MVLLMHKHYVTPTTPRGFRRLQREWARRRKLIQLNFGTQQIYITLNIYDNNKYSKYDDIFGAKSIIKIPQKVFWWR